MGKIGWIIDRFLSRRLDFRVRLFNVLAMAGTLISLIMCVASLFNGIQIYNALLNLFIAVLSFGLLYYSYRTGNYQRCYLITIAIIFLVMFPVLFFRSGGYHGGMIAFFIFAVLFTVFMLEGKTMAVMAILEMAVYTSLCIWAYLHPQQIQSFTTDKGMLLDILISFLTVSIILAVTMSLHFRLYKQQQRELEKAREQLAQENAALEHINRLKTEFLGNVSHELKTPLTVISGYAQNSQRQLLVSADDGSAIADKMKIISSEAERLALMVGQILDATRIEEGCMVIEQKPCHLDEIIHTTIDMHYPILNKNYNRLDIRIEDNLPEVSADPARISQVIVNLISNAIRFTINGRITVSAESTGDFVTISVSDTGMGISAERLPFIFDRYVNRQKTGGGQDTGTGLGLYICKHIVEAHGGRISAESEEGKGTTIRCTLPAA